MSRESVEVVRQPITLKGRPRRSLEERIYVRFPSIPALLTRAILRLSPRSRLRQVVLLRATHSGFDATNRGDFEVGFLLYHPRVELITPPRLVGLGFDPVYRGVPARFEFQRRWAAEWGEMHFEPEEMLDVGDQVLYVGRVKGSGLSSGVGFEDEWGVLYTIGDGQLVREQPFFDRREALQAVGLRD